jgi:hypothetical protein
LAVIFLVAPTIIFLCAQPHIGVTLAEAVAVKLGNGFALAEVAFSKVASAHRPSPKVDTD